jgi:hypothetical protein
MTLDNKTAERGDSVPEATNAGVQLLRLHGSAQAAIEEWFKDRDARAQYDWREAGPLKSQQYAFLAAEVAAAYYVDGRDGLEPGTTWTSWITPTS